MKYELYTGRYTDGPSKDGVCSWTFDGEVLRQGRQYGELTDPSYVLPQGDRLYGLCVGRGASLLVCV